MPIINQVVAGGGTTPTGTIQITTNGTHDVTNYATADVNVPTTAPAYYVEKAVNASGVLSSNGVTSFIDLTGVTEISSNGLNRAYSGALFSQPNINMSSIKTVQSYGMSAMFEYSNIKTLNLSGVTSLDSYALQYVCRNSSIESVDLSNLETVSSSGALAEAFRQTNLNYINLNKLKSANACGNMCYDTKLTSVSLPALETIVSGGFDSAFKNTTTLVSASMPLLKNATGQRAMASTFENTGLTTFKFESLTSVTGGNWGLAATFSGCGSLVSLWFYALSSVYGDTSFNNMLQNCTNVTVHFPMAIQSTIGSWSNVTAGFGGTNTTVLFDLVTSLTGADGNTYTRQEKDRTSTATAWVYNDTLYYTSGVSDNTNGVNEPSVSDAIYSDAACTQSVTTITAIA